MNKMALAHVTITGVLIFSSFLKIEALPIDDDIYDKSSDKIPENGLHSVLIDQRQNGTENYRITVDGVVIAITNLESLLSATLSDFDTFDEDFEFETVKPAPQNSTQSANSESTVTTEATVSSTSVTNAAKNKRRKFGVSGFMRTIFNRKPNSND